MSEEKEIILESVYQSVPLPKLETESVVQYFLEGAQKNVKLGKDKWMTNTLNGETLYFNDIEPLSRRVAFGMKNRGMGKGDFAIYLTSDITRIHTIVLGIWRLGGGLYSSYPEDNKETLLTRIIDVKAKWIFCDPQSVAQCKSAAEDAEVNWPIEIFVFGDSVNGCTPVEDLFKDICPMEDLPLIESKLDDILLILCTSGTTGKSKGAVFTNKTILNFCLRLAILKPDDKPYLLLIRPTHVQGVLLPLRNLEFGNYSLMMPQITGQNILEAVDKYKPRLIFGFPTFLTYLATDPSAINYDRTSIEFVWTGGIVLQEAFYKTLLENLPNIKGVINSYGMTECPALTNSVDMSPECPSLNVHPNVPYLSAGLMYPDNYLKVIDLKTGKTVGPMEKGELLFKSPVTCEGYWNRPEDTLTTFKDGWIHSGDLGYYDQKGFIFIVDRIKETFKYFNNHISPAELEDVILKHSSVSEVCIFGILDPNGGDTIPRAAVVLKEGAKGVTSEEILAFTHERVEAYKQIRGGLFLVESLPRAKTGKVSRILVKEMITEKFGN